MNLQTALNEASYLLKKKKIISASLDSEILLSHVIKKDREYILLNLKKDLKKKYIHEFEFLIKARSLNTPVSYLIGKKKFLEV